MNSEEGILAKRPRDKTPSNSKEERIRGLAPFYESGHIYHIQECPQIEELEIELLQFPSGRHDDIIDDLANVLLIASPPPASRNADRRDDDPRSSNRSAYKPRSALMGIKKNPLYLVLALNLAVLNSDLVLRILSQLYLSCMLTLERRHTLLR